MEQLTLNLRKHKSPKINNSFVPEQHYVNGNVELYWKQPINRVINDTYWRAYYAFRTRHVNRRPAMNL